MTAVDLTDVAEIERLALRPGDAIVYKHPRRLDRHDYDYVSEQLKTAFPDRKILILEDGADLAVLRAEEEQP